jgi:hypothetical protein
MRPCYRARMPGGYHELQRAIRSRIAGVAGVEIFDAGHGIVTIVVVPTADADRPTLPVRIAVMLEDVRVMGLDYQVEVRDALPPDSAIASLSGRFQLAAYASDQTADGMREGLMKLVPTLARLVSENDHQGRLRYYVADATGQCSEKLLQDVRLGTRALGCVGFEIEVLPASPTDPRNELTRLGVPRHESRLDRFTEEEEDVFAKRVIGLVSGRWELVPLLDDAEATSLLVRSEPPAAPLSCMLPIYDRVLLALPPAPAATSAEYFSRLGIDEDDLLLYCERKRVVPVFERELGHYPEHVVRRFLEDPALPFVTARQLDYVAARHAWRSAEYLRALREDPTRSQQIFAFLRDIATQASPAQQAQLGLATKLLGELLWQAENFEGIVWRRGHFFAGAFSPALPVMRGVQLVLEEQGRKGGLSRELAANGSIRVALAAQSLALGQVLGASVYEPDDGIPVEAVAQYFRPAARMISAAELTQMGEVLRGLRIAFNPSVPAKEYVELFDRPETARVRRMVADILRDGESARTEMELRDAVQALNADVAKIRKAALEEAAVDVVGDIAKEVSATAGYTAIARVIDLALKAFKAVGPEAFDAVVEDTRLGSALDTVRGALNGVSPHAIRLYRIRRKLGRL